MEKGFNPEIQKQVAPELEKKVEAQKNQNSIEKIDGSFGDILKLLDQKNETLKVKKEIDDINQLKEELADISQEILISLSKLKNKDKLTPEEINDEIINIPSQLFRVNEIVKNNFIKQVQTSEKAEPIFDTKDVGEIIRSITNINHVVDSLDLPKFENEHEFSELLLTVQKATKPIGYGEFAQGMAEKVKDKLSSFQEKILESIKTKINTEKVKRLIDKLQQSEVLPKIAYGVIIFTVGLLATNPFKELEAQVNVSTVGDSLKLDINGLEIKNVRMSDLDNYLTTENIDGETINNVYNVEIKLNGVNYDIKDLGAYQQFIDSEMDRVITEVEEDTGNKISKANMKREEWAVISARIAEDNLEYDHLASEKENGRDTEAAKKESEKIDNMPLDKLIMGYGKGKCRHYAAAVESISDNIKEITNSPYLKNIKMEELAIDIVGATEGHGINVIMAKVKEQGEDKLTTSYICSTWDDDGKFGDDLEILPKEEYSRDTNRSFIKSLSENKDLFNLKDQIKIYEYIAENYPQFSAERMAADQSLVDYYYTQAIDENIDAKTREDAFMGMKKFILDQGYNRDTGDLYKISAFRWYLSSYNYFKNSQVEDNDSSLDLISEHIQAANYFDKQQAPYYYCKLGQNFEKIGSTHKAEEYYSKYIDSLDEFEYESDSIDFSDLYSSTERLKEIYEKQGSPEKILDVYLKILKHDVSDQAIYNFIGEFLDYFEERSSNFSNEQKEGLITAANKLSDEKLKNDYINKIEFMPKFYSK